MTHRIAFPIRRLAFTVLLLSAATPVMLPAQTLTQLLSFNGTNGSAPDAPLVQGLDGDFYGTTSQGGANQGTIFKISPNGTLTPLYSFAGTDGSTPVASLVLGTDGNFYGTTSTAGPKGYGTIFLITPSGVLTTLHDFANGDGASPTGALVQGFDGNFYGTTESGGSSNSGTVFKITPTGAFTSLFSFASTGGTNPYGGLVQNADGTFYGATTLGGASGGGTVFNITSTGTLTTLNSFDYGDTGAAPRATLLTSGGEFYGTTFTGGAGNGNGTVFKMTPTGTLTTLATFVSNGQVVVGANPTGALIQGSDGNFYGTTFSGTPSTESFGTIFRITATGTVTPLANFNGTVGSHPYAGLLQGTDGTFYGTTQSGGSSGQGTVYQLSAGLAPFVKPLPLSGKTGAVIRILGTDLTGATAVSFNGVAAAFHVVSSAQIAAIVPAGASTGKIEVTTPAGVLFTTGSFVVRP